MRYPISENVDVMSYLLENELSRDSTIHNARDLFLPTLCISYHRRIPCAPLFLPSVTIQSAPLLLGKDFLVSDPYRGACN
jgi:hypothetical protein